MKPGSEWIIDGHKATVFAHSKYHVFVYFDDGTDIAMKHESAARMVELGRMVPAQPELSPEEE